MASYHLSVKTIKRSAGRSATAAAAYRSGERIECEREGRMHDYSRKTGIEETFILAPENAPDWAQDRAALWNAAEAAETRKNSVTAREWEVALPSEISAAERSAIARGFAQQLVDRYGVVADVAVHAPHREGDQRNHHAHILTTTRRLEPEGFTGKTRELDAKQTGGPEIERMRGAWAELQNAALERAGQERGLQAHEIERVDHRSLAAQRDAAIARGDGIGAEGLDRAPEVKLGPAANAIERREMRAAEAEGREYEAVTARGAQVHAARQARALFDELRADLRQRVGLAREAYGAERDSGAGRVSAGLAALRAAVERDRGRGGAGEEKTREDMRERLGRVLERGGGMRDSEGAERDGDARERAERGREEMRDRLAAALDRARPVGPGAAEERAEREAREAERERVREAARERTRGLDWGR